MQTYYNDYQILKRMIKKETTCEIGIQVDIDNLEPDPVIDANGKVVD